VHQLGGKFGSAINVALTEAIVDADVLALDIAELLQTLAEARDLGRISRRSPVPDLADARDLCRRLLCGRLFGRDGQAGEPGNHDAARQTITGSARCRGIALPVPGRHYASPTTRQLGAV